MAYSTTEPYFSDDAFVVPAPSPTLATSLGEDGPGAAYSVGEVVLAAKTRKTKPKGRLAVAAAKKKKETPTTAARRGRKRAANKRRNKRAPKRNTRKGSKGKRSKKTTKARKQRPSLFHRN